MKEILIFMQIVKKITKIRGISRQKYENTNINGSKNIDKSS